MPSDKKLASSARHRHIDTRLFAFGQERQIGNFHHILAAYLRMPAVRHIELVVEASEDRHIGLAQRMAEHAEHLGWQIIFGDTIKMVQPGLRRPAYI